MLNLSNKIKQLFERPKNIGVLDILEANVKFSEIITPDKTTHLQLFLEIKNNKISDAKFKALGCPTAMACMSFVTEYLQGRDLDSLKNINAKFLIQSLEINKEKYSVAGLVEDLVRDI